MLNFSRLSQLTKREIVNRTDMETKRTKCIRCGQCCLKSSPTLQEEDISLIEKGILKLKDLYTIRRGELAINPVKGGPVLIESEMVKIREKENAGGCIFYEEVTHSCTIYHNRPSQCVALKCWDTSDFMRVFSRPKADRKGIIKDPRLLKIIREHDNRCGLKELEEMIKSIEKSGERAVEEIIHLLRFDLALRENTTRAFQLEMNEIDFVLGRPLKEIIVMFGLQVRKEKNGCFLLTPL